MIQVGIDNEVRYVLYFCHVFATTAAVTFEFPKDSIADVNCAMSIVVLPNKVERLASLLFNAPLETNGNVRELILPDGLCVIPKQLQGSPPEAVTGVFGPTVAAALESAPYRKIEVSEAGPRVATRCVTMSECFDGHGGAVITVVLGRREASKISFLYRLGFWQWNATPHGGGLGAWETGCMFLNATDGSFAFVVPPLAVCGRAKKSTYDMLKLQSLSGEQYLTAFGHEHEYGRPGTVTINALTAKLALQNREERIAWAYESQ
ncbi:hypothetical protein F5883DRAFT_686891 [Diaporthe sp. PMI_573]|nr:hypothetical protein F5883DRAFT_686891 [Diaporthaceae sp. PMI_573]